MKRIKQRLLSLAMTGALLLGFALPEALAGSAKSSNESSASETQTAASKKNAKKQSKKKTTDAQAAEKSSKAKDKTGKKAESAEDKSKSSKSEASEEKKDSDKAKASEKKEKNSKKEVSLTLSISKPDGLSVSGGVWQVDPDNVGALTLSWKCKGDCDSFEISVSGGVYSASTKKKSAKIPVSDLKEGKYTATVKAIHDGKTVAREKLSFQIIASSVNEASEAPESESIGNGGDDESAVLQPEADLPAKGEEVVEAPQDASQDQSADEALDAAEEQPVVQASDDTQYLFTGEALDATKKQPMELVLEATQDLFIGEAKDAPEEQPLGLALVVTQDQSVDDALDAAVEQPDQGKSDVLKEALVEETNDAEAEHTAGEERLDLSEPDIQTPREDLNEIQMILEGSSVNDVTIDALDEPEIQLAEADEALELGEQAVEAELQEDNGVFIYSNADDAKKKADNSITLSIRGANGVSVMDDAVHVNPAQASTVTLVWSFGGSCDGYAVNVSGGVYDGTTKKNQLKLPVKKLSSGQYTVTVAAKKGDKALSSARLSFIVDAADSEGETAGLAITVTSPQGLLITEGVYQVDPDQVDALALAWQYGGECDAYDVSISGGIYSGRTEEDAVTVPLSQLAAGTYTVTVVAIRDDEAVAQASLSFNLIPKDDNTEEDPGKDGRQDDQPPRGGQRGGKPRGGTARNGGGQEAEQGFHVTPGQALISTHTSGNRDMRFYGAIALTLDAETAMNVLTLGDTALDIRLSDGGLFTASLEADALALVPQGEAQAWLLNGYALKTLARSGVTRLCLTLDDMTVEFPTQPELSGSNYGALRAAGRTSRDYSYAVASNGCTVTVAGQTFQLTAEGELA